MSADTRQVQSPSKYDRLIAAAKAVPPVPTIVVHPCDETSLRGAVDSATAGIIRPTLVGPEAKIRDTAKKFGLGISGFEIVNVAHSDEAAAKGVELIHAAKGEMLMKGSLHTDELMRAASTSIALSNASGPSSTPPVIWPRSAILQSAAASIVDGILLVTVSTADRIATRGDTPTPACT